MVLEQRDIIGKKKKEKNLIQKLTQNESRTKQKTVKLLGKKPRRQPLVGKEFLRVDTKNMIHKWHKTL